MHWKEGKNKTRIYLAEKKKKKKPTKNPKPTTQNITDQQIPLSFCLLWGYRKGPRHLESHCSLAVNSLKAGTVQTIKTIHRKQERKESAVTVNSHTEIKLQESSSRNI